jgi:hypothetical protein
VYCEVTCERSTGVQRVIRSVGTVHFEAGVQKGQPEGMGNEDEGEQGK